MTNHNDVRRIALSLPETFHWVDAIVISRILVDLESDGRRFYSIDSGQSAILVYLDPPMAAKLNQLIGDTARPVLESSTPQNHPRDQKPGRWWEFWRH